MVNEIKIEAYMRAFLYELEISLNNDETVFNGVHFQLDEANSDKEVKAAIKNFILDKCHAITLIDSVVINSEEIKICPDSFEIENVLVPDDYTEEERARIRQEKDGKFTNPDMILICVIEGETIEQFIELKSTKKDKIPGSSVQQVVPNGWVVFIKHTDDETHTITGQYKESISGTMRFPDRSPRPEVSYKELENWLNDFRASVDRQLVFKHDDEDKEKEELINNWQGVLSRRWMRVLLSDKKESGEPWFNNNLRKFALDFIDYFEKLDETKKSEFIEKIKSNIED